MIEELHRFIQVANSGNITQTAKNIFITQSALSQSIHRLEKALGTQLFTQKGKTLSITDNGKAILQLSNKILDLWQTAKEINKTHQIKTIYTLGSFDNGALRLGQYFQKIHQEKRIHLELVIDASEKILSQLRLGILDVALCVIDPKQKLDHDLLLVQTFSEELIPVSAKKMQGNITTIPFILYNKNSHTRNHIDEIFLKHNIHPVIFAESTSVTFMKELAMLGCGIALLPENEIRSELKQKILIKQSLPVKFRRTYGLYITQNGKLHKNDPLIAELTKNLS